MKTLIVSGMIGTLLLCLPMNAQESGGDELWTKTVANVKAFGTRFPGEILMKQRVINGKGETESENETILRIEPTEEAVRVRLERFIENGEDHTDRVRADVEKEANADVSQIGREIPFDSALPGNHLKGIREQSKVVQDISCRGYEFEYTDTSSGGEDPYRFTGTVWVDPDRAIPLQIEFHLLDVPRKEEGAKIISLSQTVNYRFEEKVWKRHSETQEVWVNARVLFKKFVAVVHTETRYRDHWQPDSI